MTGQMEAAEQRSVFISYTKSDEATANVVRRALQDSGLRVMTWADEIVAGDRLAAGIRNALDQADFVVLLLSKEAVESQAVQFEAAAAIAAAERSPNKHVIPVVLDQGVHPSGLLASYKWITLQGDPREVATAVLNEIARSRDIDKGEERRAAREWLAQQRKELVAEQTLDRATQRSRGRLLATGWGAALLAALLGVGIGLAVSRPWAAVLLSIAGSLIIALSVAIGYYFGQSSRATK